MCALLSASCLIAVLSPTGCRHVEPVQSALPPADGAVPTAEQLLAGGAACVSGLCRRLVPADRRSSEPQGNDTAVRIALHGAALRAAAPDTPAAVRAEIQAGLLQGLADAPHTDTKAFIIRQLEFVADANAVRPLADCLPIDGLCEPASRTLLAIGGEEAANAFRQALPRARNTSRISIVKALGKLRDFASAPALLSVVYEYDPDTYLTALRAIAETGAPVLARILLEATESESRYIRSEADAVYLRYLVRRAERGYCEEAVSGALDLVRSRPDDEHVQCPALFILSRCQDDRAIDGLLGALSSDSARVRGVAAECLASCPPAMVPRLAELLDPASPEKSLEVLQLLGELGDANAIPALVSSVSWDNPDARRQAIMSLARAAGIEALDTLIGLLDDERDGVAPAAAAALASIADEGVNERLGRTALAAEPGIQVRLTDVLEMRRAKDQFEVLATLAAKGDEPVRERAVKALGALADRGDLSVLLGHLLKADSEDVREASEKALMSACRRINDPEQTAPSVAAALSGSSPATSASLIRVLGTIGGEGALDVVRNVYRTAEDPALQDSAVRVLSAWREPLARDGLRDIVSRTDSSIHRILALRGYVRLIGADPELAVAEKLALYRDAMQRAGRPEEKRLVVSGMSSVMDRAAFRPLLGYLDDAELGEEAASAVIALADAVRGEDSIAALETVIGKIDDDRIRKRARETLADVDKLGGCIMVWEVAGPYTDSGKGHTAIFPVVFPPEKPGGDPTKWTRVRADEKGKVDLKKIIGGNNRAAYLRCNIIMPGSAKATLQVGSDDGVKVWINGAVVHENNVPRPFKWCEDTTPVSLRKGVNTLMLKVTQGGGDWAANARVQAVDGGRLPGMNLSVGEVTAAAPAEPLVSPRPTGEKWKTLFDGTSLDAWQNASGNKPSSGWKVIDGNLVLDGKGGYIWSREQFGDFVLELDFNTDGNSGLFFRTENLRDPVQTGIEMQIHKAGTNGKHGVGALYDLMPPARNAAREGWNHLVLTAQGSRIGIQLNGTQIIRTDLDKWKQPGQNPDGSKNKFKRPLSEFARKGHIGFQDHGAPVRFRHIRIKALR